MNSISDKLNRFEQIDTPSWANHIVTMVDVCGQEEERNIQPTMEFHLKQKIPICITK
jgi:hypothetical protein